MTPEEIDALIRLAEDDNPTIAEEARELLVRQGATSLAALQGLADRRPALAAHLTGRIRAQQLEREWARLAQAPDAEAAALLLAQWLDPLLARDELRAQLDALAAPLRGRIPSAATPAGYRADARALREWLAVAKGFRGALSAYYQPENALLPHVLQSRRGLPLSLSMIYLFVARRLGAPLWAIGLPGHLIVRYGDAREGIYLDPYHQGALMTPEDCYRWLYQRGQQRLVSALHPISDHALIERLLRLLVNSYAHQNDLQAVAQSVKYFEIWTDHHAGQQGGRAGRGGGMEGGV